MRLHRYSRFSFKTLDRHGHILLFLRHNVFLFFILGFDLYTTRLRTHWLDTLLIGRDAIWRGSSDRRYETQFGPRVTDDTVIIRKYGRAVGEGEGAVGGVGSVHFSKSGLANSIKPYIHLPLGTFAHATADFPDV